MGVVLVVENAKSVNGSKLHETVDKCEAVFPPAIKVDLYVLNKILLLFGFSLAAAAFFSGFYLDIEIWGHFFWGFFNWCLG